MRLPSKNRLISQINVTTNARVPSFTCRRAPPTDPRRPLFPFAIYRRCIALTNSPPAAPDSPRGCICAHADFVPVIPFPYLSRDIIANTPRPKIGYHCPSRNSIANFCKIFPTHRHICTIYRVSSDYVLLRSNG